MTLLDVRACVQYGQTHLKTLVKGLGLWEPFYLRLQTHYWKTVSNFCSKKITIEIYCLNVTFTPKLVGL